MKILSSMSQRQAPNITPKIVLTLDPQKWLFIYSDALEKGYERGTRCNPPTESSVTQNESDINDRTSAIAGIELPYFEESETIIYYTGFTLSYNEAYEQAEWVAYQLTDDEVLGTIARTDNFRAD